MAKIANPRKTFNFRVEVNGLDQFEIQTVQLPEMELEEVKHGDTNHDIKTAGKIMVGDMTWEKIRPAPQSDTFAWDQMRTIQDQLLGGGALPIAYKQILIVKELDSTGLVALNRWICEGCWVKKISQNKLDRTTSENVIETITFSVDRCYRV